MVNADRIRNILFFALMGVVVLVFFFIMKPFFFPIFWAAVIASVFRPLYSKLHKRIGRPDVCSVIVLILILLILILPAGIIGRMVITESLELYSSADTDGGGIEAGIRSVFDQFTHHPYIQKLKINEKVWIEKLADATKAVADYVFTSLRGLTENVLFFLVKFGVMLYALYFFIRDGDRFLKMLVRFFPLGNGREKILYEKFKVTARAALKVTLIIGGIQGMLGALIFFITGIKGALTWGIIMIMTSIVPSIGCSIIWAPAGLIMLATGHTWEGFAILAFGLLVISTVDQFLRPLLLGMDVEMHPLMIFLSTLGGIMLFGLSGFIIGPIVTALFMAILEMYEQYYTDEIGDSEN